MMKNLKIPGTCNIVVSVFVVVFLLTGCTAKNPRLAEVFLERGMAYIQQGQYTAALKELLEAKKQNPDDPTIRYYLGIAYYTKRLNIEAVLEFKEAISLKPGYSEAHNYLGMVYCEMGRWDDAIAEFKKAVSNVLYETPAGAYNNMGYAYYRKGDYQTALVSFDEAFTKDPNTLLAPLIEKNRGMVLLAQGRVREAINHLKKSLEIAPDFPETHYLLAKCHVEMKDLKEAEAEFRLVLKLAPDSELAEKAKESLAAIMESR
ncbi:MAG: tetratricopeptide repeat protein [Syntrophobacterales bacterium]|jgi:Tfp pilus assembly protein PilF|nr:tetratricopeptide repeat protein [Syntrophobacterales bacterium]